MILNQNINGCEWLSTQDKKSDKIEFSYPQNNSFEQNIEN